MSGVRLGSRLVSIPSGYMGRLVMMASDSQHAPKHRHGGCTPADYYQKNYQWRRDHRSIPF